MEFIHTNKPKSCLEDCEAQCCYDAEVFCENEAQLNLLLSRNPNSMVKPDGKGGFWVSISGLCGANEGGVCILHNDPNYPKTCSDFEAGGEDCMGIRGSEDYPIELKQRNSGFISLDSIDFNEP